MFPQWDLQVQYFTGCNVDLVWTNNLYLYLPGNRCFTSTTTLEMTLLFPAGWASDNQGPGIIRPVTTFGKTADLSCTQQVSCHANSFKENNDNLINLIPFCPYTVAVSFRTSLWDIMVCQRVSVKKMCAVSIFVAPTAASTENDYTWVLCFYGLKFVSKITANAH